MCKWGNRIGKVDSENSIMEKFFFDLGDIVVWQGIITKYGVIQHLFDLDDQDVDIRKADKEEINRYDNRPEK